MKQALIDYIKRGPNDELYTPIEAIEFLLPHIPKWVKTVWEPTSPPHINNNIITCLNNNGFNTIQTHIDSGFDFISYPEPSFKYDAIITNPPYSLKDEFLEKAFKLEKPFAFLLPITTLEGKRRGMMFAENGINVIIPNKRFQFLKGKSGAWFTNFHAEDLEPKGVLYFKSVE